MHYILGDMIRFRLWFKNDKKKKAKQVIIIKRKKMIDHIADPRILVAVV